MTETKIAGHLRVRSCPACHYLEQQLAERFAEIQGLLSRSEEAQIGYAAEGGFCPLHTWQLAQFSSPRGISRGHAAIMRRLSDRLIRMGDTRASGECLSVSLKEPDGCRVCRFLADEGARYITAFCVFLERDEHLESYGRSHGLCLRHLRQALARPMEEARKTRIIRLAADRFREIGESMLRYDQKLGELQRGLLSRDEKDAYRRGLVMLSGERTVFSPFMKAN